MNQIVLYIAALIAPATIIGLILVIFSGMGLNDIGIWLGLTIGLIIDSIVSSNGQPLVPWYITIITIIVATYGLMENRGVKVKLNE